LSFGFGFVLTFLHCNGVTKCAKFDKSKLIFIYFGSMTSLFSHLYEETSKMRLCAMLYKNSRLMYPLCKSKRLLLCCELS